MYEGNYKNGIPEGKGICYFENGDRYEGDWKNYKREGNGIMYFNIGGRAMGDYLNDKAIGKHIFLQPNGEVTIEYSKWFIIIFNDYIKFRIKNINFAFFTYTIIFIELP